jgi:hypothetical protein
MKTTLLLAACLAFVLPAWAALDAGPQLPGPGELASTPSGARYTHRAQQLPSGTMVHEYVDVSGRVFAVAWSGPFQPDLRSLLGTHFDTLTRGAAAHGRNTAVSVQRPEVVIVSAGRMGAFQGRAWLPGGLPQGFDPGILP